MLRTISRSVGRGRLIPLPSVTARSSVSAATVIPLVINAHGAGVALKFTTNGEKPHIFNTDALPAFGGADSAPSPLYYALASLGSCNQVTASLVARDLGIRLGAWSISVQGDLDTQVLVQAREGNANFNRVVVRASVQTDASEEQFARLVTETERRCPISQLYKRSGLVFDNKWERTPLNN